MPDATPETACQLLYRYNNVLSAVRSLLRRHGNLTAYGKTFVLGEFSEVFVLDGECDIYPHASEIDGPADFRVADAVTNPDDLVTLAGAWEVGG